MHGLNRFRAFSLLAFLKRRGLGKISATLLFISIVAMEAVGIQSCTRPSMHSSAGSRNQFIGWFTLPGRTERKQVIPGDNTLIPIFQRDGTCSSVCRGFEVPLKSCPEGLEWALAPSSMAGTKIGWDEEAKTYYLAVRDSQARDYTDGRYGSGEKEAMTKVSQPAGLLNPKALRPHTDGDFVGTYQLVWFPWVKLEVRQEGARYVSQEWEFSGPRPGSWKTRVKPSDLTPLPDQPGFSFGQNTHIRLVYNLDLKRFELVAQRKEMTPSIIRAPLARIPSGDGSVPLSIRGIGIPSWH